MTRILTDAEILRIQVARANGVPVKELAARFGVSIPTISSHMRNTELIPLRPPTRDELVLAAFPWAHQLPAESRVQFAEELAHQPKGGKEGDVDRFIRQWRDEAEASAS